MLAYYANADECKRQATPRDVLEVVQVRDWDGATGALMMKRYKHAFEIDYLGGATYQCHCDSLEDKQLWMQALQHALDEPNRIVQDEIEDAQRRLLRDSEQEDQAMTLAAEAVRSAQRLTQEALGYEQAMKENAAERHALEEKVQHTRILYEEAKKKSAETRQALDKTRQRAHDVALDSSAPGVQDEEHGHADEDDEHGGDTVASERRRRSSVSPPRRASSVANEVAERVGRLAAQLEVDTTLEETHHRDIEALDQRVTDLSHQYAELFRKSRDAAEESQQSRDAAVLSLQQAQSAKQLAKLRIESWTTSSSHLDPLADGYLLCKHPYKPTMHRRYYVLFGNTLCWYKDADTYTALPESPAGVVHVSGVADWNGKIGGMKVLPHAFSVVTVEGKMLCCSAPTRQSVTTWTTALHIGVTMPPLSPHRAVAAKSRRDSFDLVSSMVALSPKKSASGHFQFPKQPAPDSVAETGDDKSQPKPSTRQELENQVVVEGYLVKKSAFVPVMKKKYCVLKGLRLFIFDSHDAYQSLSTSSNLNHEEIQVCSISDWDGHGALLHYNYGFQIQTLRHQAIFCSAANNEEKDKWVHGIRASLLRHRETLLSPTRREDSMIDRARKSLLRKAQELTQQPSDAVTPSVEPLGQDESAVAAEEFQALLLEFYTEHNPGKVADVPMLISRYRQREHALVEHLDRIYGTALASDMHIGALLDKLTLVPAAAKQQALIRRKSSGIKSGLVDFVKMAGYLAWNNEKCYCILSVNKLVRYRTQTQYETEPYDPVEAIVISSVYEYPPPADFVPGPASKNTFFISYSPDLSSAEPSSTSPQSLQSFPLALSSATVEEKLKWMAKIRSGLGFAHANAERASSTTSALVLQSMADASGSDEALAVDKLRLKLVEYYKQQNPRKVGEVDTLLSYFAGRERQLLVDLDATYGTNVAQDPSFLSFMPRAHDRGASTADRRVSSQYESYLWVKHPLLGVAFQRCYCVLNDETWSCYHSSRHAHADGSGPGAAIDGRDDSDEDAQQSAPLLVDVVVNLHVPRNEKPSIDGMTVFSIETLANGPVLLRTDVDKLTQDWTNGLRKAADKYHLDEQKRQERELEAELKVLDGGSGAEANRRRSSSMALVPIDGPARQLYDLLMSFYQLHNPEKVGEVGTLLHAFKGRERKLLEEIDVIYHSKICADPTFIALLAAITESQSSKQERDEAAAAAMTSSEAEDPDGEGGRREILMEGYLVKRGHLIPSMRKRYCVLKNASLEYFATHEDSRNPAIRPHGNFQVEIVSDWHGKTASKVYDHGMELETSDGKTFFCAAYNADDKAAWMHAFKHAIALTRAEQQSSASDVPDDEPDELEGETESAEARAARRAQFRERLVQFYREKNPKKLADLNLLLTCYTRREFALLEAIDNAYGTALSHDASLLALVPQTSAHSRALATLQYDGSLLRCSDSSWRRSQSVHVAMNGLVFTFYASREGFKGGILSPSDHSVTVLAVKEVDTATGAGATASRPVYRFAIETTDHVWMYFEAPNAVEKRHWVQILHAALDTILAQSLLEEELQLLQKSTTTQSDGMKRGSRGGSLLRRDSSFVNTSDGWKGFLLVRLDFMSEAEHAKKRDASVVMEERHFVLHKHNQLVIYNDVQDAIVATFTTLATSAWDPSNTADDVTLITTKGDTKCRFPFQILTLEQIVLSCSAATDLLRAKWIKQIRSGAERATALEMLQDQQLQAKNELEHHRQHATTADSQDSAGDADEEVIIAPGTSKQLGRLSKGDDGDDEADVHAVARQGYLDYKLADDTSAPSLSSPLKEGFFVVTQRAEVDVFADEATFYRNEAPVLSFQAVEIFDSSLVVSPSASASLPPPSPSISKATSSSAKRHLHKLFGDEAIAASAASSSNFRFCIQTKERDAKFVHLFPASASQHEAWVEAFRLGVNLLKGEELLADEKLILHLEEEEETKEHERKAGGDGDYSEVGLDCNDQLSLSAPGVAIEGILTPWRLTFSSPRPVAAAPLFYVLVGCRLRCFASKSEIPSEIELSATRSPEDSRGGLLDADIVSISDWEIPQASAKVESKSTTASNKDDIESVGFQVEVVVPPSQSKQTLFFSASSFDVKHRWVRVIKSELDFALAETYLDEDAREFARQVAAHMNAIGRGADSSGGASAAPHRHEGYVRVRHHFIGSIWRERFAVLDGTRLLLYTDSSAAIGEDRERTALEKHDLIAVEKWHPTYSANLGSSSRFGFRVENEAGGYLECTVATEDEQTKWLAVVTDAVSEIATHASTKVMARDTALPFIPGAAMEGYLKTKEKKKLALFWKSRYCVVIGTQWLLYESQEQAIGGGIGDETAAGVPPLAVYEIAQVGPWVQPEKSSERILEGDDELALHGFSVQVSAGIRIDCKAQSSLERKRWLNAMEDQLAKSSQESVQVLKAMQHQRDKEGAKFAIKTKYDEVQSDAKRQSVRLREALQLAAFDDETSSSGDDDDDEDSDGNRSKIRPRSGSDFIDRSPESSPMRRKTQPTTVSFANTQEEIDSKKAHNLESASPVYYSIVSCFSRCFSRPDGKRGGSGGTAKAGRSITPLGVPGFPANAEVWSRMYKCEYYNDDGYTSDSDW